MQAVWTYLTLKIHLLKTQIAEEVGVSEVVGVDILRGRFLAYTDELYQNNVCVITAGLAQRLFSFQDPLDCAALRWS